MGLRRGNTGFGSAGFDAVGSSGGAFVSSSLEIAMPKLIEPLISSSYARDVPVGTGGGYPEFYTAYVADYATSGGNGAGLQGSSNTDIPVVMANPGKVGWKTNIKKVAYFLSFIDLQRMNQAKRSGMPMPFSIPNMLDTAVRMDRDKTLDYNAYLGLGAYPGLVNNPSVTATVAANGAAGTPGWSTKTANERLADINAIILSNLQSGVYDPAAIPNRILLPFADLNLLNTPMTTGGFSSQLEYILNNNLAKTTYGIDLKINGLPDPYIAGQGVGSTNRMVAYNDSQENLKMQLCTPLRKEFTLPTTQYGGGWETIFDYCFTPLMIFRTQTISYLDGI
jgi:hypothetical protein